MAVGDVRFFKALIAGFSPTTLNPIAAGWTQITSTSDLGQDATHLVIIDNGLIRIVLDKNATAGTSVYFFNGSTWATGLQGAVLSQEFRTPTLTAILNNSVRFFRATLTITNVTESWTGVLTLLRGLPFFGLRTVNGSTSGSSAIATVGKTALASGTTVDATDIFGASGHLANFVHQFAIIPCPSLGIDIIMAVAHDPAAGTIGLVFADATNTAILATGGSETNQFRFYGFMPRTYGLGDGGGANVGNGASGQLREAEDNYTAAGGASLSVTADANCSGAKRLDFGTPASGHKATYSINFPAPGIYYLMTASLQNGSTGTHRLVVDGVNGATTTIPNTGFATVGAHVVHGPFTIAAAGNKTVTYEIVAVGNATGVFLDHISVFPYEATASTPTTQIFPKNLAQSLLRLVTPS